VLVEHTCERRRAAARGELAGRIGPHRGRQLNPNDTRRTSPLTFCTEQSAVKRTGSKVGQLGLCVFYALIDVPFARSARPSHKQSLDLVCECSDPCLDGPVSIRIHTLNAIVSL